MARIGYIMEAAHYEYLQEDTAWMEKFGCIKVLKDVEESETTRPVWKQLVSSLQRNDTLVISKFSNALRGSRELAVFLEYCRVQDIRIVSIHDKLDSADEVFPPLPTSSILFMFGSLPHEALALRRSSAHYMRIKDKVMEAVPPVSAKAAKLEREKNVVNMYVAGHSIEDIWEVSGYSSRSSIFRILNKHNIKLNRGSHSEPLKKKK